VLLYCKYSGLWELCQGRVRWLAAYFRLLVECWNMNTLEVAAVPSSCCLLLAVLLYCWCFNKDSHSCSFRIIEVEGHLWKSPAPAPLLKVGPTANISFLFLLKLV